MGWDEAYGLKRGSGDTAVQGATMTAATTEPARGTRGRRAEGHGLIVFAAASLVIIGCFNLIYGIVAIASSHVFAANAGYMAGSLRSWGWITLIIGALQMLAAWVAVGNQLVRQFAVAVPGLNAIGQMFFIPAYPFWPLTIAVDVVALYGLCAFGDRANLTAASSAREPAAPGRGGCLA